MNVTIEIRHGARPIAGLLTSAEGEVALAGHTLSQALKNWGIYLRLRLYTWRLNAAGRCAGHRDDGVGYRSLRQPYPWRLNAAGASVLTAVNAEVSMGSIGVKTTCQFQHAG